MCSKTGKVPSWVGAAGTPGVPGGRGGVRPRRLGGGGRRRGGGRGGGRRAADPLGRHGQLQPYRPVEPEAVAARPKEERVRVERAPVTRDRRRKRRDVPVQ